MSDKDLVVDHVGIVVRNIEKGIELWEQNFGYRQLTEVVLNTRQQVKVVFLEKKDSVQIKLIEPSSPESPIAARARAGGGLHHLCFRSADMARTLQEFESQGMRVITQPQPGEAFNNEDIAFVFAGQGLNIEVVETTERAKLL